MKKKAFRYYGPEKKRNISSNSYHQGKLQYKKNKSLDQAVIFIGIFVSFIIFALVLFSLFSGNKSSFILSIKDPQILVAQAGSILPLELKNSVFLNIAKTSSAQFHWEVSSGNIESQGEKALWSLPKRDGIYTVKVSANKPFNVTSDTIYLVVATNPGLAVPTNPILEQLPDKEIDLTMIDSDNDGLSDYYEINISNTDPYNADTSGDGIIDGVKVELGLDPLQKDLRHNEFTGEATDHAKTAIIKLKGSPEAAADIRLESFENDLLFSTYGILERVYYFETEGEFQYADLIINYNLDFLNKYHIDANDLAIAHIDFNNHTIVTIPSVINQNSQTISAKGENNSFYALIGKPYAQSSMEVDLVFVIDDSGSMMQNDPNNLRLEVSDHIATTFLYAENRYGVVSFADNGHIFQTLTHDNHRVMETFKDHYWESSGQTNIGDGLLKAISLFDSEDRNKIIVLLSDGEDTSGTRGLLIEESIRLSQERDIIIYTVGLGHEIDVPLLESIAHMTNGRYFFANDSYDMQSHFLKIQSAIQVINPIDMEFKIRPQYEHFFIKLFGGTDTTKNKQSYDNLYGILIADSGFEMPRDSLPFSNSEMHSGGICFGFAAFCSLHFNQNLSNHLSKDNVLVHPKFINKNSSPVAIRHQDNYILPGYNLYHVSPFNSHKPLNEFKYNTLRKIREYQTDENGHIIIHNGIAKLKYNEELKKKGFTIIRASSRDALGRTIIIEKAQNLSLEMVNDENSSWSPEERNLVNSIFYMYHTQPFFSDIDSYLNLFDDKNLRPSLVRDHLHNEQALLLSFTGNRKLSLREIMQGLRLPQNRRVGHAVVIKKAYAVVDLGSNVSRNNWQYCYYIYDNNFPDKVMPMLVSYRKVKSNTNEYMWMPTIRAFGYDNIVFDELFYTYLKK